MNCYSSNCRIPKRSNRCRPASSCSTYDNSIIKDNVPYWERINGRVEKESSLFSFATNQFLRESQQNHFRRLSDGLRANLYTHIPTAEKCSCVFWASKLRQDSMAQGKCGRCKANRYTSPQIMTRQAYENYYKS